MAEHGTSGYGTLPAWHAARYQRALDRPARPGAFTRFAARVEAATPAHRDRAVDALRALAILGVVLGHWLVTAFTATGPDGMRVASPLRTMPELTPVSWLFQTLAVFFLVGGYGAAKGLRPGGSRRRWAGRRLARLARPVPFLLLAWVPLTAALAWAGLDGDTLRRMVKLVLSPLWFLAVYGVLVAATPLVAAAWRRVGVWLPVAAVAATAALDLARFGLGGPEWIGWPTVLTGWLVPFSLGVAWADGAFRGRRAAVGLLAGGTVATAALVLGAGYPAAMVGVPGAPVSNLNPPTLAAVAFGLAQTGAALLLRGPLTRWTCRPRAWAAVATANLAAMTIFLWHQSGMMLVTAAAFLVTGPLAGLHTSPDGLEWVPLRLVWLPAFALVLAGLCLLPRLTRTILSQTSGRVRTSHRRVPR
ncbi:acyltransferase family protein [Actinomadura kijaniata]|uniref:acyltransferase family protein n=1 Tax=Actinomadura kijaniata TaxID=46161 RepID=UPI00083287B8|nr:acyltransferase [Actinomadura kijaniata]